MFGGVIAVPLIVGGAACLSGGRTGLQSVFGAVIAAGVIGLVIAPFFSQIVLFFPPVVTGSIITVIGLSLMPVAAGWIIGTNATAADYASPSNIALAGFTLLVVLVLSKIPQTSRLAILLGLVIGTVGAFVVGKGNASGLSTASIVALPTPFSFGAPAFAVGAIVSMVIVILVIMVETTADLLAVGEVVGTKVDSRRVSDGLRADMLSSTVAPVFNTFPATAFAQNVGLVALSGITSRYAVALGGGVLVLLGLSPWLAAVVGMVPLPVLGGAGIVLFGSVAASGVRTLSKVSYTNNQNMVIVAVALAFGIIPVVAPAFWKSFPSWFETIFHSGISAASIMAVLLNLFFNVFRPSVPKDPTYDAAAPPVLVREGEPPQGTLTAGCQVGQACDRRRSGILGGPARCRAPRAWIDHGGRGCPPKPPCRTPPARPTSCSSSRPSATASTRSSRGSRTGRRWSTSSRGHAGRGPS
jgi:xanthine permease